MKFLVMGYGRGGTTYTCKLFQYYGYDLGHELVGKDGYCGWEFSWPGPELPCKTGEKRTDVSPEYLIHLVRDPWLVLNSNMAGGHGFHHLTGKVLNLSGNDMEREMQSIMQWHDLAQSQKPCATFRVDRLFMALPVWLVSNGIADGDNFRSRKLLTMSLTAAEAMVPSRRQFIEDAIKLTSGEEPPSRTENCSGAKRGGISGFIPKQLAEVNPKLRDEFGEFATRIGYPLDDVYSAFAVRE